MPFSSIINPEPRADDCLSCGAPNSLNISSNGEPGGNWKGNGLERVVIVVVVEIFTTEGINFSAKSAKEAGTLCEFEFNEKLKTNIKDKKNSLNLLILIHFKIYYNEANNHKN